MRAKNGNGRRPHYHNVLGIPIPDRYANQLKKPDGNHTEQSAQLAKPGPLAGNKTSPLNRRNSRRCRSFLQFSPKKKGRSGSTKTRANAGRPKKKTSLFESMGKKLDVYRVAIRTPRGRQHPAALAFQGVEENKPSIRANHQGQISGIKEI